MQGLNFSINNEKYIRAFLTDGEIPKIVLEDGTVEPTKTDSLLPWAAELPEICHKARR